MTTTTMTTTKMKIPYLYRISLPESIKIPSLDGLSISLPQSIKIPSSFNLSLPTKEDISDHHVGVILAVLGGIVVGGVAGSTLTARYLRSKKKEDDIRSDENENTNTSRRLDDVVLDIQTDDAITDRHRLHNFDGLKHVNFLSDIMDRLWPYINRAGCASIIEIMEPTFKDLPGPLKSLKFVHCDLGNYPIVIDNIIVHDEKDGAIQFDWDVIWKTSCNIQLKAALGIAFGVKAIELQGRMSFLMKPLSDVIPCFDAVTYSFINPPTLEIDFTGLADVADWSIVESNIRKTINDSLASMMVLPVRMMTKISPASHIFDIYTPLKGVARVTVISGRGFVEEKRTLRSVDVPDVYLKLQLGTSAPWRTPTVRNDRNPNWVAQQQRAETKEAYQNVKDFLVADLDQILSIQAWDEDKGAMDADDLLGYTEVTVAQLLLAGRSMELELWTRERKGSSKPSGALVTIGLEYFPFTTAVRPDVKSKNVIDAPINSSNQIVGLITVLVSQAFDLPVPKDEGESFVRVLHGDKVVGSTSTVTPLPGYDALNPLYNAPFHIPLTGTDCLKSEIKLTLINKATVIGEVKLAAKEILAAKNGSIRAKKNVGEDGASLEFALLVLGLASNSDTDVTLASVPSISPTSVTGSQASRQIDISILKGHGFAAKKKGRFRKVDVPDVYCILSKFGSSPQSWRTKTIKNSIAPKWDEARKFYMTSANNVINVDVYNENRKTKDDYYGSARISVGKVMLSGGTADVEITSDDGRKTGLFLTISVKYTN